jgi:hypothetical protein
VYCLLVAFVGIFAPAAAACAVTAKFGVIGGVLAIPIAVVISVFLVTGVFAPEAAATDNYKDALFEECSPIINIPALLGGIWFGYWLMDN